jgi:hypothetical protein
MFRLLLLSSRYRFWLQLAWGKAGSDSITGACAKAGFPPGEDEAGSLRFPATFQANRLLQSVNGSLKSTLGFGPVAGL